MFFNQKTPRRITRMVLFLIIFLSFCAPTLQVTAEQSLENSPNYTSGSINPLNAEIPTDSSSTGDLITIGSNHIETFTIDMPQLESKNRTIIVYLPSGYFTDNSSYPVLYVQGAQELFMHSSLSDSDWYIDESLLQFYASGFTNEFIIVGITSDPIHFWDEYSPWVNDNMYSWMDPYDANRVHGGEGDAYLDFLVTTLKPEVDRRFRTLPDASHTAIGGYDMGALISMYAGLTRYNTFSRVLALSPAVWFAEEGGSWLSSNHLIELIETIDVPENVSFYIDVAEHEINNKVEVRPVVKDAQGKKITFPQAYLEGAGTIIKALMSSGVSNNHINQGDTDLISWAVAKTEEITRDTIFTSYYFPLFTHTFNVHKVFDHFDIYIPFENRTRRIWVYLPPDYDNMKSFPVIYLLDAQHMFGSEIGANISSLVDWEFDEKLDEIHAETGKGIIAVGVEYDYTHAWDEYMPWDNNNMDNWLNDVAAVIKGQGKQFLDFIIDDLKPVIDSRYRTLPDRENTAIGGGSRVALFSLYAGLSRPDIFSKVMAMSPAVWLAEGGPIYPLGLPYWLTQNQLVGWIYANPVPTNVSFYLYVGEKEMSGPPEPYPYAYLTDGITEVTMPEVYVTGAFRVRTALLTKSAKLIYKTNPDGLHYPSYWRIYIKNALDWLGLY